MGFDPRSRVGSDAPIRTRITYDTCFDPRSRVGSDARQEQHGLAREVSIHAPAWGATGSFSVDPADGWFRSTLPRGERHRRPPPAAAKACFDPRSRVGSDARPVRPPALRSCFDPRSRVGSDDVGIRRSQSLVVSIHAPAWGATIALVVQLGIAIGFDPRSRVGSDAALPSSLSAQTSFDPRSRVGSDHAYRASEPRSAGFDPRSRVGSDNPRRQALQRFDVSIHAPAWGATSILTAATPAALGFDPRSRVGSDLPRRSCGTAWPVSIHAPAWGATTGSPDRYAETTFRSTLPRGERPRRLPKPSCVRAFRSTLPRGERPCWATAVRPTARFDPRSRVGSDTAVRLSARLAVFRSTLPRGERPRPDRA